ncbi:MAG: hypothetical protein GY748_26510, partial [Planctomycetaceae bacterium]|nr:hypothetical protein [Planctomycetaceae bacterium]
MTLFCRLNQRLTYTVVFGILMFLITSNIWLTESAVSATVLTPPIAPEFIPPQTAPPASAESQPNAKTGINFLSLLTQGGWFMLPLIALSLGVVTIAIERFMALRREKIF